MNKLKIAKQLVKIAKSLVSKNVTLNELKQIEDYIQKEFKLNSYGEILINNSNFRIRIFIQKPSDYHLLNEEYLREQVLQNGFLNFSLGVGYSIYDEYVNKTIEDDFRYSNLNELKEIIKKVQSNILKYIDDTQDIYLKNEEKRLNTIKQEINKLEKEKQKFIEENKNIKKMIQKI